MSQVEGEKAMMTLLTPDSMVHTRLYRQAGHAVAGMLSARPPALPTVVLRSLSLSLSTRSPHPSTSRLTLDGALGQDQQLAKSKPKGKAKTPPKNRQPKPLPELDEEDLEEQFVRGQLSSS